MFTKISPVGCKYIFALCVLILNILNKVFDLKKKRVQHCLLTLIY